MPKRELPIRDEDIQSPEQQERVTLVEDRSTQGAHSDEDLNSYVQLAYYAGKQWLAVSRTAKTVVPLPKEDWQVQYTANRIMPIVRTELAKITRNKLTKTVVPASTEDEDIRAARLAEKVVEWLEYDLELQEQDQEAILWALTTRIGFIKPLWNPNKGTVLATENGKQIREGDIDVEIMSLFEVKWDPAASRWKDVQWVIHERPRTVDYVQMTYGVEVTADEGMTVTNLYDGKLRSLTSGGLFSSSTGGAGEVKNMVMVREMWESPSLKYPQGRRITTGGGKELHYSEDIGFGPEDKSEREIPIFEMKHINIPGKIIGSSVVEQLMPVQREYNKSRSQIQENKNLMANPQWVVESGSLIEGYDITNMPGGIIMYQKGFNPPNMSQPTSLGADVEKNVERCLEEFMFISGQQEVSHGATPTGVTSGVAIQMLQDQDDTKLGPNISQYARYKQKYLSYCIKMIKYKYTIERTVKVVGRNKRTEAVTFKGSELTSCDIRMDDMSLTQLSKSARQAYIVELVKLGVLNPQMDKDLIIRMLELGITDELYDGLEQDVQQAMNENGQWSKGDYSPIVRDFYNHEVHVAQHNRFRKGEEYDALDPQTQMLIDEHVRMHMEMLMMSMMPASEPTSPVDGADPEKIAGALTPKEQQILQQNPQLMDQAMAGGTPQ